MYAIDASQRSVCSICSVVKYFYLLNYPITQRLGVARPMRRAGHAHAPTSTVVPRRPPVPTNGTSRRRINAGIGSDTVVRQPPQIHSPQIVRSGRGTLPPATKTKHDPLSPGKQKVGFCDLSCFLFFLSCIEQRTAQRVLDAMVSSPADSAVISKSAEKISSFPIGGAFFI